MIPIRLVNLRNNGYIRYMSDCIAALEKHNPPAMGIEDELNALKASVDAIELVFKQRQDSAFTEQIARLDVLRDEYLAGILLLLDGYLKHYDTAKRSAAQRLRHQVTVYGSTLTKIVRQSMQGETTDIDNLVHDLQHEPRLSADLTTLGLSEWVEQLRLTNDSFAQAYRERMHERALAPKDTIKDLRTRGNKLYYQLRDTLMSRALLAGYAAPYDTVINTLNAITRQYNQVLAHRSGTAAGKKPSSPS